MIGLPAARAEVELAQQFRQADAPERVLHAAACLVASWWAAAAGYGIARHRVDGLALIALDAVEATDADRWAGHR